MNRTNASATDAFRGFQLGEDLRRGPLVQVKGLGLSLVFGDVAVDRGLQVDHLSGRCRV